MKCPHCGNEIATGQIQVFNPAVDVAGGCAQPLLGTVVFTDNTLFAASVCSVAYIATTTAVQYPNLPVGIPPTGKSE